MTNSTRELLRNTILLQLHQAGERGAAFSTLALGVRVASFRVTDDEISEELAYLRDKGLAVPVTKMISPENSRTRITADGRDYLATEGLA
jgi:hypothetical protein